MTINPPNRIARSYIQHLIAPPSEVFPLLCPVREGGWIEGWAPRQVLSESGLAEPDCVFTTADGDSEAVWVITRHDPGVCAVEMVRVTPGVTVCRLTIEVAPHGDGSAATVTYRHTSLGPAGDEIVNSFTEEYYRGFMEEWERRLNHYLDTGRMLLATETSGAAS